MIPWFPRKGSCSLFSFASSGPPAFLDPMVNLGRMTRRGQGISYARGDSFGPFAQQERTVMHSGLPARPSRTLRLHPLRRLRLKPRSRSGRASSSANSTTS